MASAPLKPCRHAGCTVLTRDGWCDRHRPQYQRGASAEYHDLYSSREWRYKLRPQQLTREPFCRACAEVGIRTPATIVDHIKPHRGDLELFRDPSNLQSLCKYHHDRKTLLEQMRGA